MSEHYEHIACDMREKTLVITLNETELRDNHLAIEVAAEMTRAVEAYDAKNVVLDLEKLVVLTSAALLPILGLRGCVKQRSGELVLCNLSDLVAHALTVSQLIVETRNLKAHLKFASDVESALALL